TCSPISNGIGSDKALTLSSPYGSSSHLRRILLRERSNLFESHWSNQWLTNFSQATNEPEISVFSVDFPSKFTDRLETIWQSSGAQQNLPGPRLPLEPTS